ncbi:PRC-barrel domain-containing protein [Legionella lytica]|uniref:PRC-barrel domain-containing protein n=1 Tax=Legionella lytica TaxID=96232 RepID=A0ABW8DB76_9GAMM
MENHNIVKASEVTDVKVQNTSGEDIGEINEIVLDKISGQVNYLVLDFGGFLSFGNKFFAIPWKAFSYDKEEDCFILNVAKERLQNAPGFDKEQWPNFADRSVTESINQYYQL